MQRQTRIDLDHTVQKLEGDSKLYGQLLGQIKQLISKSEGIDPEVTALNLAAMCVLCVDRGDLKLMMVSSSAKKRADPEKPEDDDATKLNEDPEEENLDIAAEGADDLDENDPDEEEEPEELDDDDDPDEDYDDGTDEDDEEAVTVEIEEEKPLNFSCEDEDVKDA